MKASVGDRIVVVSPHIGSAVREGRVVELRHPDGTPPYVVEWLDTGQRAVYFPGSDGRIVTASANQVAEPAAPPEFSVPHVSTWTVTVHVYEQGGDTTARAVLHAGATSDLEGRGVTHRNPADADVPEIGDEVAVSRALRHLADSLMDAAQDDMTAVAARPN